MCESLTESRIWSGAKQSSNYVLKEAKKMTAMFLNDENEWTKKNMKQT